MSHPVKAETKLMSHPVKAETKLMSHPVNSFLYTDVSPCKCSKVQIDVSL